MYKDFISAVHKSTKRDYLKRVNDKEYPKDKAAKLAIMEDTNTLKVDGIR